MSGRQSLAGAPHLAGSMNSQFNFASLRMGALTDLTHAYICGSNYLETLIVFPTSSLDSLLAFRSLTCAICRTTRWPCRVRSARAGRAHGPMDDGITAEDPAGGSRG